MHIANISDPQIPAALAPVVVGIKGLHNFLPHPLHRMGSKVQFSPDAHGWVKLQSSSGAGFTRRSPEDAGSRRLSQFRVFAQAQLLLRQLQQLGVEEDVAPYDFAKIYNLPSTWPSSTNGSRPDHYHRWHQRHRSQRRLQLQELPSACPPAPTPVIAHGPDGDPGICTGGTNACNGGDLDENSLDVEWSGAVAPGAQIVLVTDAYNSQSNPSDHQRSHLRRRAVGD